MKERAVDREQDARDMEAVEKALADPGGADRVLGAVCGALRSLRPHFDWVGIYRVTGRTLTLAAWAGPRETEHTEIAIGDGICGAAARSGRTEIVGDVTADERYLACFASTRSEVVVPVLDGDRVVGEIDIDSDASNAFDEGDRAFLEAVAGRLTPLLSP